MKILNCQLFLSTAVSAHYAIKSLVIDGTNYLARDARLDDWVGAKRIEWSYTDNQNFTWMASNDVSAQGFACGSDPVAPPLQAPARAGSNITVQWTKIPRHHWGPSMNYLGRWSPGQTPQTVSFFKIKHEGYNAARDLWANEMMIDAGNQEEVRIPSDIKPGTYIFRSELLSLHGNGHSWNPGLKGLPQFYTHCFNLDISGSGNATPTGVRFPGGYSNSDRGVKFVLGSRSENARYPIPGPKPYDGRIATPQGTPPSPSDRGRFPAQFEPKYQNLLRKMNSWSDRAVEFFDGGKGGFNFINTHQQEAKGLMQERSSLREEAIRLGLADAKKRMQISKIF